MKATEKILLVVFSIILLISGFIRFKQTENYSTSFTYDQARDMLDIRALGEFKDIAVLGPTTSINGLRLGPFYYYFNLPAYWLGGGSPQALVYWNILLFLGSAGFVFWYFRKKNVWLGFLIGSFIAFSPRLFDITRNFWNANMATYLSIYFFVALWNFLEKKDNKSIFWLGMTSALLTQFEAAFGIVCVGFSVLIILLNKKANHWKGFLLGLIPWFLPQILLEVKNKFQMTKLLLGFFDGSNQILGDKMALGETITSHIGTIKDFFEGQFILPMNYGLILLVIAIVLIVINKKYRKFGLYFLAFLGFGFLFYVAVYHHELKLWYLESLRIWYCFVVAMALVNINKFQKLIGLVVGLFLLRNIYLTVNDQWQFVGNFGKNDPKKLDNLIKNVDWVYEKMDNDGFEAYSHVPEIYDYPNQYLYWWYGVKKYGYMPNKISYSITEVPEYMRTQNVFYRKTRESKEEKIALIYEIDNSYIGWLNQFKDYCITEKIEMDWSTRIEIRERCKN